MRKNLLSKILATTMALCLSTSINLSAATSQMDTLVNTPPTSSQDIIQTRGSSAPSSKADIHDLSVSSYEYQALDMGYRIYTSKWITGATKIKITVKNWSLLESYYGATNNKLTLRVYNSSKKQVTSKTITISSSSGSATLTDLSKSSKYYVCFEVPTNGNRYSYNGTISSAD